MTGCLWPCVGAAVPGDGTGHRKAGLFRSKTRTPTEVVQHVRDLVTYVLDNQDGCGGGKRDAKLEHRIIEAQQSFQAAAKEHATTVAKIKVSGTTLVLDEIINHVQSFQRQVEYLLMRLAAVNPRVNFGGLDSFLTTEEAMLDLEPLQHEISSTLTKNISRG